MKNFYGYVLTGALAISLLLNYQWTRNVQEVQEYYDNQLDSKDEELEVCNEAGSRLAAVTYHMLSGIGYEIVLDNDHMDLYFEGMFITGFPLEEIKTVEEFIEESQL